MSCWPCQEVLPRSMSTTPQSNRCVKSAMVSPVKSSEKTTPFGGGKVVDDVDTVVVVAGAVVVGTRVVAGVSTRS